MVLREMFSGKPITGDESVIKNAEFEDIKEEVQIEDNNKTTEQQV